MRILKQLTRKKNAFFRGIKFNVINYRYRNKPARKAFDPAAVRRVLLLRLDDKVGDMVVTTGCARILAERGYQVSVLTGPICSEILAGSEFIQQVYLYRPRMSLNTLRAAGFDAVIDFDDVVVRGVTVVREGEITWPAPPIQVSAQPQAAAKKVEAPKEAVKPASPWRKYALMALAIILFGWLANVAPKEFLGHFTVFALACVVGYYVVWNVSHALHTPLMSVTNAISGIIVVGALLQIGHGGWVSFLSFIAVLIASINIFGGFTVTQRMLKMFRKG